MSLYLTDLEQAVEHVLRSIDGPLRVATPLGLGKPHRLINVLYRRMASDISRTLHIYTALSLSLPAPSSDLEKRFLQPFLQRHFGADFPDLEFVRDRARDALPAHITIEEFYLQSGSALGSSQAQRQYASLNYTDVAKAVARRGMNVMVQKVALDPDGSGRLSLSCNTDLTLDALDALAALGKPRPLLVAEIDPQLPWMDGQAAVAADFFDIVVTPPAPHPQLFGLPRQPVSDADYAIGLYASALVRDGGTLQIGIGTLADALSHALVLRHTDNATYRRVLHALDPALLQHTAVRESGGLEPFSIGLYGCSEMLNEGFKHLVESGVIRRKVVDDEALMQRLAEGSANLGDHARLQRDGQYLQGAFYLGSPAFYDWLRQLPEDQRRAIGMRRISEVNQLYGSNQRLEQLQRVDSRFFNSCMMATALGAAVSDGLEDGRVVSGVGGQYNFVAMAHALPDARSVLMLRATRDEGGKPASNIRWNYGHTTIPRHQRDIFITEYGIADLLGQCDEDCVIAMASITDARFQASLLDRAKSAKKLAKDFAAPAQWQRKTPEQLRAALAPFRHDQGALPDYPLGSDFTPIEQRLAKALGWLKSATATRSGRLRTVWQSLSADTRRDAEALQRMGLDQPTSLNEKLSAKLVALALQQTLPCTAP